MVALLPITAFLQASESAKEVTSPVAETSVSNLQQSSAENNTNSDYSVSANIDTLHNSATNLDVEIQTRFNKIQSELLDQRALYIDRWLAIIAIVLTFFGVVVAIAGFMGIKKIRDIEKDAKTRVENIVADAEKHLQEFQKQYQEMLELVKGMQAQSVEENPTETTQKLK